MITPNRRAGGLCWKVHLLSISSDLYVVDDMRSMVFRFSFAPVACANIDSLSCTMTGKLLETSYTVVEEEGISTPVPRYTREVGSNNVSYDDGMIGGNGTAQIQLEIDCKIQSVSLPLSSALPVWNGLGLNRRDSASNEERVFRTRVLLACIQSNFQGMTYFAAFLCEGCYHTKEQHMLCMCMTLVRKSAWRYVCMYDACIYVCIYVRTSV